MLPTRHQLVKLGVGLSEWLWRKAVAFLFDRHACFPVPTWRCPCHGGATEGIGRSGATRSHAQRALAREHGEDGEHRTFPDVSTVAGFIAVGVPDRHRSIAKRYVTKSPADKSAPASGAARPDASPAAFVPNTI
jgi:hypothetical protein